MIAATMDDIPDAVIAGLIMLVGVIIVFVVRHVVHSLEKTLRLQSFMGALISRFFGTTVILICMVYAFRQLGVQVGPLLGALGVSGIVFAMSLQPVLGNLVGSALLHARRPIKKGDQLQSNGYGGTVVDINGRAVVMITFDGERVHLPNLAVLESPLLNQTAHENRRTILPFQVAYESDLRQVQKVVVTALAELSILEDSPRAEVLVAGFDDSGINLEARVWHPSEELLARYAISEAAITIHETLRRENITIPFPQRVMRFVNDGDGSPISGSSAAPETATNDRTS